jgi:Thioredoxin like C-terminal domain
VLTPETYLGSERAHGFVNGPIRPGPHRFTPVDPGELPENGFAYGGAWLIDGSSARALGGASLSLRFRARRVFLVLGLPDHPAA